jgi:Glycosyl hydrolases family 2/Glycosyl hydrolases family 2, sugar binding domain
METSMPASFRSDGGADARQRDTLSLDGSWDFHFEGPTARLDGEGHQIRSPGIWQTQFPALRNAHGMGRYVRRIDIPAGWDGKRIFLVMEGVFHQATIFVDGKPVATNDNGWTTLEVDLTDAIEGAPSFILGVDAFVPDDRDNRRNSFGFAMAGKQDWYGIHGGIWKPARLEARDAFHFSGTAIQASTDLKSHGVTIKGALSQERPAIVRVALSQNGAAIAKHDFPLPSADFDLKLAVADVELWSPDAPNLYDVRVELISGERIVDALERAIGFRHFESRDARLYLNGQPFYMFGALDQDWYPVEDCRSPSDGFLEQRFKNAKAMGLNTLRCHVKIPDKLYFELADRLGLIVWLDMPYTEFLAPSTRDDLRGIFRKSVVAHGHHPSICLWTICNEGWGIDLDDNPDDRHWLIETFDALKDLVPTSLVVDNSPCFPRNYHVKTDIEDFHWYNGFPHQNAEFARLTNDYAARAQWTWSPHDDAVKTGLEPLICSEFGVWGLPHPRDIRGKDGGEPWWFESGHDWNNGAGYPHGIETRFRDAQLSPIFGDLDGFVDAAQEFQYRALKYQIETLRWARPISGYIITEINDVQWESNGLMDVQNHPRRFADRLANLQRNWLIIARSARTTIGVGENLDVSVALAGAAAMPPGARLAWKFGEQGGAMPIGANPAALTLSGPKVDSIGVQNLELEASDGEGTLLSRNVLEFCIAPPLAGETPSMFPFDAKAADLLGALVWPRPAASLEMADVVLATRLTSAVRELLLAGRKVLLVANDADALVDPARKLPRADRHNFPTMDLRPREGTPWDGRWMGAFAWRRGDGPWAGLPNGPMLDEHWTGLTPNYVLTGFMSTAFGGLVDAGVAVGWLHKAAAFTKRSFLGKGWMTVSTFEMMSKEAMANPLAPHVLRALGMS